MQESISTTNSPAVPEVKMENFKEIIPGILVLNGFLEKKLESLKAAMAYLNKEDLPIEKIKKYSKSISKYGFSASLECHNFLFKLNHDSKNDSDESDINVYILNRVHRLKGAFGDIGNFGNLLDQDDLDISDAQIGLVGINKAINRVEILVKRIIAVEKSGEVKEIFDIDLSEEIKNIINSLEPSFRKKKIKIESQVCNIDKIKINRDNFESIINNIISNAIKFTNENGLILIKVEKIGNSIVTSIKDSGIGISKEKQINFFKNLGSTTIGTNGEIGTGYGMFTSKEIANKMGGELSVESGGEGKGTTFILTLPIEENSKE